MITTSFLCRGILVCGTVILSLHLHALSGAAKEQVNNFTIVDGSTSELLNGYNAWMLRHKEVLDSLRTNNSRSSLDPSSSPTSEASVDHSIALSQQDRPKYSPLLVRTPSIDLYAPSGISVLHSTDNVGNPQIIESLSEHGLAQERPPLKELRPTLKEALQMFESLKPYENSTKGYVLFALTCSQTRCDGQRKAIDQLRAKESLKNVRVIEVNLH
jgi:hypothetical protein